MKTAVKIKQNALKKSSVSQIFLWTTYDHYKVCRNKAQDVICQARLLFLLKKVEDHIKYLFKAGGTKTSSHAVTTEVLTEFFGSMCTLKNMKPTCQNFLRDVVSKFTHSLLLKKTYLKNCQHLIPVKLWVQIKSTHGF